MVGAQRGHDEPTGNIDVALREAQAGSLCKVCLKAANLQTAADGIFYPDVFVTCDAPDCAPIRCFARRP